MAAGTRLLPAALAGTLTSFAFWATIALVVLAQLILFDLRIIFAPQALQVQYIPDDAYYYLLLAKNFVRYSGWTFDSGLSHTSGFHLLLAYLLVFVYALAEPGPEAFVQAGILISGLFSICAVALAWSIGLRLRNTAFMVVLAVMAGNRYFAQNSVLIIEWSLVLCFAILYVYQFYQHKCRYSLALIFLWGLGGVLARSDFGMLPLMVCLSSAPLYGYSRNKSALASALSGLAGASLGLAIIFIHTYLFTGSILQTSARMKAHWSQFQPDPYYVSLSLISYSFGINTFAYFLAILAMLAILVAPYLLRTPAIKQRSKEYIKVEHDRAIILNLAATGCIVGYTLFYTHNGGLQQWYTANLIVPLFILSVTLATILSRLISLSTTLRLTISSLLVLVTASNMVFSQRIDAAHSPWPHQQLMLAAGEYLRHQSLDGRIGAWNAGIIAYHQGGGVINLDGLVNDDIYAYAVSDRLGAYLERQNIRYIIDFASLLEDPLYRARGGYDDPAFLDSLQPLRVFDSGQYQWKHMTLWRVGAE